MPADFTPFPGLIKIIIVIAIAAGVRRAFLPCRGVTKIRVNQRVFNVRNKHKGVKVRGRIHKCIIGYSISKSSNFITSGTEGDFRHAHRGAHIFPDRVFTPVYRLLYASGKLITLVEQGILQMWALRAPIITRRQAARVSLNTTALVNSYLGLVIFIFIGLLILML